MIRKIQFAPANNKAGPKVELSKQFMMSDKPVHVEAALEKEVHLSPQNILLAFWTFTAVAELPN